MAQLFVQVLKRSEDGFEIILFLQIKKMGYLLPEEFKDLNNRNLLAIKRFVQNTTATKLNTNGFRTIALIRNEYMKRAMFVYQSKLITFYLHSFIELKVIKTNIVMKMPCSYYLN